MCHSHCGYYSLSSVMESYERMYCDEDSIEMFDQEERQESYEGRKLKRRESDAKCRANISAGFDILKDQVHAVGSQEKVSKETVLQQSLGRIKYLEGVLIALHQTKELSKEGIEKPDKMSPLQHLRNIHHQFVASQQRKWSQPKRKQAKHVSHTSKDKQGSIKRMARRRRPKRKAAKKTPLVTDQKKQSPIVHLPPALHTSSRPQKRIKLASTEPSQDQVVPFSSILSPALQNPGQGRAKKGALSQAGSQMVPEVPSSRRDDTQKGKLCTNENIAPPSPMADACRTPCKVGLLGGSISTPMKIYQIVGTSITPVKIDYQMESPDDGGDRGPVSRTIVNSPDLECDEEPSSWPDDDSSSSGGSMPELHISHPWFSTPVHPTSLLKGNQPLMQQHQQHPPSEPPVLEPQTETGKRRRKKNKPCCKDSGEKLLKDKAASRAKIKSRCTTPRKRYQKRATAARVRAWDSASGKVLSPVQPYSGVFKTLQQQKVPTSNRPISATIDVESLAGCLDQKLPILDAGEGFMDRMDSDIVYMRDFTVDSDEEVIDLLGSDGAEAGSESTDPMPSMQVDHSHSEDSSPTCLRDVSLPPPAGTISPPSLVIPYGVEYDESPELFKGYRAFVLKEPRRDNDITVDADSEMECDRLIINEEGFYDYNQHHETRCHPDDAVAMDQEEDLFEADLGDMRHLDPALQPPSSSLEGEDYIVRLREDNREEPDYIDVEECRGSSLCEDQSDQLASAVFANDVLITPALATFATSALSVKHAQTLTKKGQRKRRNVRLNLPRASLDSSEEEDDLNIWKFTQAALNEKDVLRFLPPDSSYALITNAL